MQNGQTMSGAIRRRKFLHHLLHKGKRSSNMLNLRAVSLEKGKGKRERTMQRRPGFSCGHVPIVLYNARDPVLSFPILYGSAMHLSAIL